MPTEIGFYLMRLRAFGAMWILIALNKRGLQVALSPCST